MKFTTDKPCRIEYDGEAGPVTEAVARGLTFVVVDKKNAAPLDLGGRTMSKDIYIKYYAPPAPEPEPEPEQTQDEE